MECNFLEKKVKQEAFFVKLMQSFIEPEKSNKIIE